MKNMRPGVSHFAIIAAALFAHCGTAQAATITWEAIHSGSPLDFLNEKWGSNDSSYDMTYSNTWNITTAGFQPGVNHITGITVWFSFADDMPGNFEGAEIGDGGDAEERVDISLGGYKIFDDLEVDGRHPAASYAEYSLVLDPILHASIFSDLAADGKLTYLVELQELLSDSGNETYNGEDTYFKVGKIQAYFQTPPQSNPPGRVPDGGASLALLGISVAGIFGLRRKFS